MNYVQSSHENNSGLPRHDQCISAPAPSRPQVGRKKRNVLLAVAASALLAACAGGPSGPIEIPEGAAVADLFIVDCLLPGQVRQLGNSTYLTPRRPIRTTAQDCRLRGGEYVAFDRADYKTALRVWLPAA